MMINTVELEDSTRKYLENCIQRNKKPTFNGLGTVLGVSGQTLRNVFRGCYKSDLLYTDTPHPTRCIDNKDFEIIQNVFNDVY